MKATTTEKLMARLQNHRWVAILILVGTIVIALSTFTDATKNLLGLIGRESPEEARIKLTGMSVEFTPEAFLKAAEAGDLTLVNLFITGGMDPSLATYASEGGPTPLFYAARENHPDVVEALLKAGAVVTGPNNYALAGAVHSGNPAILKRLLKTGVKPGDLDGAMTEGGSREMLEILVAHGGDLRKNGAEALLASRDPETAAYLRAHGADINARDAAGHTLMERENFETMNVDRLQALIALGADLNSRDRHGSTPLHAFAQEGFLRGVELALDKGVPVDAPDANGRTALSRACDLPTSHGAEIVQLLLTHGADVNAPDHDGHTPRYYANLHRLPDVMQLLADHGAKE